MHRLLAALFVLLTLPLGVFMATVVPLGQVADENAHIIRADALTHGELIGHGEMQTLGDGRHVMKDGADADFALLQVIFSPQMPPAGPRTLTGPALVAARNVRWNARPVFLEAGGPSAYMPVFYLPSAAAIGVTRWLGFSPFQAFLAARLASLAAFLMAGTAALLLARRGQALLFCTLSLPMTLNLAASVNQDGLLIAASVLAAALLTRAAALPAEVSRSGWFWAAAVLIACVATVKPPYLPLAAMLLLPLPAPWRALARRLGAAVLVALVVLAWVWIAEHHAMYPRVFDPYHAGPLFAGKRPAIFGTADTAAQLGVLLAAPSRLITMPLNALLTNPNILHEMVGQLGWLNLGLPLWLHTLWRAALVAALAIDLSRRAPAGGRGWVGTALLLAAGVAALIGIYVVQYLTWTKVGQATIDGMQGRYLLPLLPLLALALPCLGLPGGRAVRTALWLLPLTVASVDLMMLPRLIVQFYYMT